MNFDIIYRSSGYNPWKFYQNLINCVGVIAVTWFLLQNDTSGNKSVA